MSDLEDLGFDPQEYADQLGYTDELGRGDHSDPSLVRAETPERASGPDAARAPRQGRHRCGRDLGGGALAGPAAAKAGRARRAASTPAP